jgi:fumarate reductase subunit C
MNVRSFAIQRLTAILLVPFIVVHLAIIFYATSKGLSASSILERTRGSLGWGAYYLLMVALISLHGAVGASVILNEWTGLSARSSKALGAILGAILCLLGLRAVAAVCLS